MGTRYHCTLCKDYDLCMTCYKQVKHPHSMEKRNINLYDNWFFRSSVLRYYQEHAETPMSKKFIKRIIRLHKHATKCIRLSCNNPDCKNIKGVLQHGMICKFKNDGKCPIYDKYFEILKCHCTVYCTKAPPHCPSAHI